MKIADEIMGVMPKLVTLPRPAMKIDAPRCEAMCLPSKWDREAGPHQCLFYARVRVGEKNLCRAHGKKATRTAPVYTEVLNFLVKERDANSPLWRHILAAYKKAAK